MLGDAHTTVCVIERESLRTREPEVCPVAEEGEVGAELLRLLDEVEDRVELQFQRHL